MGVGDGTYKPRAYSKHAETNTRLSWIHKHGRYLSDQAWAWPVCNRVCRRLSGHSLAICQGGEGQTPLPAVNLGVPPRRSWSPPRRTPPGARRRAIAQAGDEMTHTLMELEAWSTPQRNMCLCGHLSADPEHSVALMRSNYDWLLNSKKSFAACGDNTVTLNSFIWSISIKSLYQLCKFIAYSYLFSCLSFKHHESVPGIHIYHFRLCPNPISGFKSIIHFCEDHPISSTIMLILCTMGGWGGAWCMCWGFKHC